MRLQVLSICFLAGSLLQAAEKPNILFIAIDDQNDWIGHLGGHPSALTPNIDALAERGTAFTNAHCQSPLCNPSRTSLMTGLRPTTTGVYGLAPWIRTVPGFEDVLALPQFLSQNGYETLTAGKIYHGGNGRQKADLGKEWDVIGPPATGRPFPKGGKLVNTPSEHPLVDWGVFPHNDEDKGDYIIAEWAVDQLNSGVGKTDKPFFLSVGFFLPHVPCFTTQKWYDMHRDAPVPIIDRNDRADTPRFSWYLHWKLPEPRLKFLEEANEWENLTRSYLACTTFVDDQVGKVTRALKANGLEENTVIVLWSDHGWHIGEKEITGKNTLWEDGTRVPLVFAGPGVIAAQQSAQPAELLDIYPTLAELCGLEAPDHLEGISLVPQIEDPTAARRPAITSHNAGNHGIRSEHWRYIVYADGTEELYDLRTDPNEWENLAGDKQYADVIAEHRTHIPPENADPAPGSAHRILIYDEATDSVNWEGEDVPKDAPIPEI